MRDVLVLMIIDVYASFDTGLEEIMLAEGQQQQSIEFRSQLGMARASITRMAKYNTNAESVVRHIYHTSLTEQEIVDFFTLYNECAQATDHKRKRNPPKSTNKKV